MLGESGRTMSNMDKDIALKMAINPEFRNKITSGAPIDRYRKPMMSDNEPRFETRSPDNQMFSIENEINNLMKSYNMLVESQEFDRAQQVATMIDQLQQQKIGIQGMNARRQMVEDNFKLSPPPISPERGMPPQQDEITRILDSISI